MNSLKIAFVSPEAAPFAKTGGLADVIGALPTKLVKMGHDARVFMPYYASVDKAGYTIKKLRHEIDIEIGDWSYSIELSSTRALNRTYYYFLGNEFLYNREALYVDPVTGKDYVDNDDRFFVFAKAIFESFKALEWIPDIIHANDWQSALAVVYLKTIYKDDPVFKNTKAVYTIHNMGYQGIFPIETAPKIGLDDAQFAPLGAFEYWKKINLMKAALLYADKITTVSPTYAKEITDSNEYGMGLEGVLKGRRDDLVGIVNGVDYKDWSPTKDKHIAHKYYIQNLSGKKQNKLDLLHKCGFPIRLDQPLIGIISRLDIQKGFDLLEAIIDDLMRLDLQFVLLGTGDKKYHDLFEKVEKKHPDKFKAFLAFDNGLAHLIEAGSDIFLMPSKYEPCGLNQLYSLKYGTAPIVRKTGGLADTVIDWDDATMTGTGFVFEDYKPEALLIAINRALKLFNRKRTWFKIVKQGMAQDFSWDASSEKYIELYQTLINN